MTYPWLRSARRLTHGGACVIRYVAMRVQGRRQRGWRGGLTSAYVLAILLASFFHTHRSVEAGIAHCTETAMHWDAPGGITLPQDHQCPACVWSQLQSTPAATSGCVLQVEHRPERLQPVAQLVPRRGVFSASQSRAPPSV